MNNQDIIVVGGGVMGLAAAYFCSKKGFKVSLLEAENISNEFNASRDYSKSFRTAYGDNELYARMASETLHLWRKLESESAQQLLFNCGTLLIDSDGDESFAQKSAKTMKKLNLAFEVYEKAQVNQKFPQFNVENAIFDPSGAVIHAYRTTEVLKTLAVRQGVTIIENCAVTGVSSGSVATKNEQFNAAKIILAGGVWSNWLYNLPSKATKQELLYFKPKNHALFSMQNFPIFAHLESGFYGFPIFGNDTLKISLHTPQNIVNPFDFDKKVGKEFEQKCRDFFTSYIPALSDAELVGEKVCLYNMTANEDFIIDEVEKDTLVLSGFSGHGFKFSPLIGKIAAEYCLGQFDSNKYARFLLKNHAK